MANLIAVNVSFQLNVIHSFNTYRPIDKIEHDKFVLATFFCQRIAFLSIDDSADTLKLLFTMVSYPLTEKYYDESYATWKAHLEKLLPIDGINVKSILWEKLFKYIFACLNGFYWTIPKIGKVFFGRIKI